MGGIRSANDMYVEMTKGIIKVAKETLGESRGFKPKDKESWCWNASMQNEVKVERKYFKV